jgi:amino acid transporter
MTQLLRTLRLRDLFLLFVGSVIGSGIFLTPALILRQLNGSVGLSLLVWLAGGVLSLLGALTYAELAACHPEAGGLYCYIRDGFGRMPAFLYGWCLFVVIASGTIAALARAFTRYLAEIIPLSPFGASTVSVLMLMALYLIAVCAYLVALGPVAATHSDAIAASAVDAVLGPWARRLVAVTILVSTFSATNSVILTAPRVFYAMAKDQLFFQKLAEVHRRFHTPAHAIIALGVWSCVLALYGKFAELADGVIFIGWIFYGLGAASIFPIRRRSPGRDLPYRVPGYPWTPLLFVLVAAAIVGNAVYLAATDPSQFRYLVVALVLFLLGLPAYLFYRPTT